MPIKTREDEGITSFHCDCCGSVSQSASPDGKAPEAWGTGRIRIDLSVSEEVEFQLCFCPSCAPDMLKPVCPQLAPGKITGNASARPLNESIPGGVETADEMPLPAEDIAPENS